MAILEDLCNGRSPLFTSPSSKRKVLIWSAVGVTSLIVLIVIIVSVTITMTASTKGSDALRNAPLVDGHNDFPMNLRLVLKDNLNNFNFTDVVWPHCSSCRTDLRRLRAGMVGAQFWSAYVNCTHKDAVQETLEQIDVIHRLIKRFPSDLELVTTADGIMKTFEAGKIGSMIGVEGGHSIDSRLGALRTLYSLGARYMTLTHQCDTPWASSCSTEHPTHNLTDFGKKVVREMNRLGMMVDLSHVSEGVMIEAIAASKAPVIFSHSSSRTVCDHPRNVKDSVLKKLKKNDGIIMVNFYPGFLCEGPNGTVRINRVIEHINYIVNVTGVNHVGIGADYDGGTDAPIGLEDVSKYPLLFDLLHTSDPDRWTIQNLEKLAGKNLIRVFAKVEEVRDSMSDEEPQQDWISEKELSDNDKICRTLTDVEEDITTEAPVTTTISTTTTTELTTTVAPSTTESTTTETTTVSSITEEPTRE